MNDRLTDAKDILETIGMPAAQQTDMAGYSILTLAGITPEMEWVKATNEWIRIHDVIQFTAEHYGRQYAENTRETIRKACMHPFRTAAVIEDNNMPTNSPRYRYRLTKEFLEMIRTYGTTNWLNAVTKFRHEHESLIGIYASKKSVRKMPVNINGKDFTFSPGAHNRLQKAILEEFAPRFAPGSECLYVGDTIKKDLYKDVGKLGRLGFTITLHDKMPDVVLYREDKDWLYFIEAVASVGPMSPQRIMDINQMTERVKSGKIFVTAFPNISEYKKFASQIAWETEVWIADQPDHMIHLNGNRFMGPR